MSSNKKRPVVVKQGITGRQEKFHTFTIDLKTDYGEHYFGKFTTKKLSIADFAALGVRKAQLNGGMHHDASNPGRGVDQETDFFNMMIAQLEMSIVSAPPWWDLEDITDSEIITEVFQEVNNFENTFHSRRREAFEAKRDKSSRGDPGDSSGDSPESNTDRNAGPVVVEEVQSALEP